MELLTIPSPSTGVWYLGPVPIRGYALSILVGILVAIFVTRRRWVRWGNPPSQFENIAFISIIMGIVGARIYWVLIEWPRFFGPDGTWYHIFYIWQGGLGIWGGITGGFLTAWLMCRRYKVSFFRLADCAAPGFLLAQGIGRLGNWWNQELYGLPTDLPWGLEIDLAHRVAGFREFATFHPTFLYEMLWNFAGVAALLILEKRFRLGLGKIFALYITIYAIGRSLVEQFRIDPVAVIGGLRINSWVTLVGGLIGLGLFIWLVRKRPGPNEILEPAANPEPSQADIAADDESNNDDFTEEGTDPEATTDELTDLETKTN
ncbi:MAG: prolipoprotein diacylglyceryl transferase [Propionibacteriaceae bacterium]|jgi:prolipoprotein diacylglyceryl transferase|nr:prolipoprotein diacylglyceryl transferase [Propionibacteriaceae bacterium]